MMRKDGSHWYLAIVVGFNGYILTAYPIKNKDGDSLYNNYGLYLTLLG